MIMQRTDVIEKLRKMLDKLDGDDLAYLYNQHFDPEIEYLDNDEFEYHLEE